MGDTRNYILLAISLSLYRQLLHTELSLSQPNTSRVLQYLQTKRRYLAVAMEVESHLTGNDKAFRASSKA